MMMLTTNEHAELVAARNERDRLHALINTAELVDFAKAVHLEAVHQEIRWGSADREGKQPGNWFWLVGELSSRALHHHKEAERLAGMRSATNLGVDVIDASIKHHREKAVHHCITAAAALAHWHASVLGKHTAMQPGHAPSSALATTLEGAGT